MTQISIDHSGRLLPQQRQPIEYEYHLTGTTQAGDEVYSEYGGRWLPVIVIGFHMPDSLRYRRKKAQQ